MRSRLNLLLIILFISSILLVACSDGSDDVKGNEAANADVDVLDESESVSADVESETVVKDEEPEVEEVEEISLPEESQQINEFPWEEESDFLNAVAENETDVLISGFVTVSNHYSDDELENISVAANAISGTVLAPGDVFSQNDVAGPYTVEKGYKEGDTFVGGEVVKSVGGGVCNVSTTLYNVSIAGDLDIVERHNHSMPVPYVPYGQDAAVFYGYKDYKFQNNTDHPMLIWAELIDNRLYMAFYGKEAGPEVVWEHDTISETPTSTQYYTNPELADGEENVLVQGMDGKVVDSILKIRYQDGKEEIRDLGRSSYNPLMNLIERNE